MQIPTRYDSREELIMDMNILGKILQVPSKTIEELTKSLKAEYRLKHPLPSLEQKRYEISEVVSDNYEILNEEELVLGDNEVLIDLSADDDTLEIDVSKISVTTEEKVFFKYENQVTPSIMEEFLKGDTKTYEGSITSIDSVDSGDKYILSDEEIQIMSATTETWGSNGLDVDIDVDDGTSDSDEPAFSVDDSGVSYEESDDKLDFKTESEELDYHVEVEDTKESHEEVQVSLNISSGEPGGIVTDNDYQWNAGFGFEDYIESVDEESSDFDDSDVTYEDEDYSDEDSDLYENGLEDDYESEDDGYYDEELIEESELEEFDESGEDADDLYEEEYDLEEFDEDDSEDLYDDTLDSDDSEDLYDEDVEYEDEDTGYDEDSEYEDEDIEYDEDSYGDLEPDEDGDSDGLYDEEFNDNDESSSVVSTASDSDSSTAVDAKNIFADIDSDDDLLPDFISKNNKFIKPVPKKQESVVKSSEPQSGRLSTEDDFVASILANPNLSSDQKTQLLETYYKSNKTTTKSDFGEMPVANEPIKQSKKVEEEETYKDIRDFVRKHPRCKVSDVLEHFSRQQLNDEICKGRLIRRGDIIHRV